MLRQWVASGAVEPASVTVVNPSPPDVPEGVRHLTALPADGLPQALMLGVKPQKLDEVAGQIAPRVKGVPLLLSILAGVEVAALAKRFDAETIVRVMPNLPVGLGKGVVALHGTDPYGAAGRKTTALMAPLGLVEWIEREDQFDAVTALSGCGPGFVYRFIDALAEAGAALGLPADQALRLATATVNGAAELAARSDVSPATLADRVASPGGSTREGMNVLDRDDALKALMKATLAASEKRNGDLAAAAR